MADPDTVKEVAIANKESEKLFGQVSAIKIKNDGDLSEATETLVKIKQMAKDVEARRKLITQPLNQALKEANSLFKDPSDRLADAEKLIKDAMLDYHTKQQAKAERKANKIEDQVDSGELGIADAMGKMSNIKQAQSNVSAGEGSAHFKTTTKIRIVNPAALPAKYFLRERVLEALRMEVEEDVRKKGEPVPDGAESYEEKQLAVRTS